MKGAGPGQQPSQEHRDSPGTAGKPGVGRGAVAAPACLWDPARAGTRTTVCREAELALSQGYVRTPDPPACNADW